MNILNFYTKVYGLLHDYKYIPYWLLTPLRRIVRYWANKHIPVYLSKTVEEGKVYKEVIVSFTSFPARINNVWQVVECMKRQTLRPTKIILWLSKEQFGDRNEIPESLRIREGKDFIIRFVEKDIRSYKKFYYVANEFPNDLIFLIDDDIYYPIDVLEKSYKKYLENPKSVVCNYGYHMKSRDNGMLAEYNTWKDNYEYSEEIDLFFGSGGGTLFRPSDMYKDLTNISLAQELAPMADDIWLNAMARLGGCSIIMLAHGLLLPIKNDNNVTLSSANKGENKNDEQLSKVEGYYNKIGLIVFRRN